MRFFFLLFFLWLFLSYLVQYLFSFFFLFFISSNLFFKNNYQFFSPFFCSCYFCFSNIVFFFFFVLCFVILLFSLFLSLVCQKFNLWKKENRSDKNVRVHFIFIILHMRNYQLLLASKSVFHITQKTIL